MAAGSATSQYRAAQRRRPLPRDPVLRWAALARQAGEQYEIPPALLLGLIKIESGGNIDAVSPAQAFGLTQFIPSTAASYDVRRGDARSQIFGAARYLTDLGYHEDPRLALASYNAGPGNPAAAGDYPQKVMAAAKAYRNLGRTDGRIAPSTAPSGPSTGAAGSGEVIGQDEASGALKALLWVALVISGMVLVGMGTARMLGVRNPLTAQAASLTGGRS